MAVSRWEQHPASVSSSVKRGRWAKWSLPHQSKVQFLSVLLPRLRQGFQWRPRGLWGPSGCENLSDPSRHWSRSQWCVSSTTFSKHTAFCCVGLSPQQRASGQPLPVCRSCCVRDSGSSCPPWGHAGCPIGGTPGTLPADSHVPDLSGSTL